VITTHERQIVADLRCVGDEAARAGVLGEEPALDLNPHDVGLIAVRVDAEVVRVEGDRRQAADGGSIEREPERVDSVGPEYARVANGQRLRQRVETEQAHPGRVVVERQDGVALAHRDRSGGRRRHVASEDRVILRALVVDAPDGLCLVAVVPQRVRNLAARIGRAGKTLQEVERGWTEPCGIDPVVHEPAAQRDLLPTVARGRGERRKVAGEHGRRWHPRNVCRRLLANCRALIGPEEEKPVLYDRTAECAAELIALQPVVDPLAVRPDLRERVGRIEAVIAEELKRIAAEAIAARLGDGAHRRARVHPVLGVEPARCDAEFLKRVGEGERQIEVVLRVVVHGAIEEVRHAVRESAAHRDPQAARHGPVWRRRRLHSRSRNDDELRRVAAVERQREDLLVPDHFADAGALDVDERRGALHGDGLFELAYREAGVEDGRGAHL
jgi:hypothetical protein